MATWRNGYAEDCKSLYPGSIPGVASTIYFFEDFKEFKDIIPGEENNDDLNYSFLSRTFSSLSRNQKDKILQILSNTSKFEKVG